MDVAELLWDNIEVSRHLSEAEGPRCSGEVGGSRWEIPGSNDLGSMRVLWQLSTQSASMDYQTVMVRES